MKFSRVFCILILMFITSPMASFAADDDGLKSSDIMAFLQISRLLRPVVIEMEAKKIPHYFQVNPMSMVGTNVPSHLKAVENLKKNYPEYYKKTEEIVTTFVFDKKSGAKPYKNVEDWAKKADRIMLAFYTSQSDGSGRKFKDLQAKAAPLLMMSQMTKETSAKMKGLMDMLKSFSEVTLEDQSAVIMHEKELALHFASYPKS